MPTPLEFNTLGRQLEAAGKIEAAMEAYRGALGLDAAFHPAAANLGRMLVALDRPREAARLLEPICAGAPYDMPLAVNYANALLGIGRATEAEHRLSLVACDPQAPAQAHNSLGIARYVRRNFEAAEEAFRAAVALAPDFAEAHENLALALLQQRRFAEAWPHYDWRWRNPSNALTKRAFSIPQWDGKPLNGRTLLLHAEQGFGDTIQFARFARAITKGGGPTNGGRIVLAVQKTLTRLLANIDGLDSIVALGDAWPEADCHMPLLGLPAIFAMTFETIPDPSPYLCATPMGLSGDSSPRIGIAWAGRARHVDDPHRNRSCPPELFAAPARATGGTLYSLQTGPRAAEESARIGAVDLGSTFIDFADTARAIAAMDVVVTIDSAVAHLAGAMGKPTWVLPPFCSDWRWQTAPDGHVPWYRSLRVVAPSTPGDWAGQFHRVTLQLHDVEAVRAADKLTNS